MLQSSQVEELMNLASRCDRPTLIRQFKNYRGTFPVDFNQDFLKNTSLERLQHIFVAMCLQNQRLPEMTEAA